MMIRINVCRAYNAQASICAQEPKLSLVIVGGGHSVDDDLLQEFTMGMSVHMQLMLQSNLCKHKKCFQINETRSMQLPAPRLHLHESLSVLQPLLSLNFATHFN